MAGEPQETREAEVARVRSYLASQSVRRTNAQLVETLQQAHQQFRAAVNAIPDRLVYVTPGAGEWSALDVLLHMRAMAAIDLSSFEKVLEQGGQPADVSDTLVQAPRELTRAGLLADLEDLRARLCTLVLATPADAQQEITWSHPEFGAMHWREWLLFARVHTLDHVRQVQAIGEALAQEGETTE